MVIAPLSGVIRKFSHRGIEDFLRPFFPIWIALVSFSGDEKLWSWGLFIGKLVLEELMMVLLICLMEDVIRSKSWS